MSDTVAKLELNGTTYDLPVHKPTLGPDVLDIRKLYAEADVFTFDPGFDPARQAREHVADRAAAGRFHPARDPAHHGA